MNACRVSPTRGKIRGTSLPETPCNFPSPTPLNFHLPHYILKTQHSLTLSPADLKLQKVKILLQYRFISVYLIYQVASGHGNVEKKYIVYLPLAWEGPKTDVKRGRGIAKKTFCHKKCFRDNFPYFGSLTVLHNFKGKSGIWFRDSSCPNNYSTSCDKIN